MFAPAPQSPCCCHSNHGHCCTVAGVTTPFPSKPLKYRIKGCDSKLQIDGCEFRGSMLYGDFVG